MSNSRNNDFNEKQIKGIDLCVRAVTKQFKFIKGWELSPNYKDYVAGLYINLFVDWREVAEYFDVQINPFYLNYYKDHKDFNSSSLGSHMLPKDVNSIFDYTEKQKSELHEKSFKVYMKIYNMLNSFYKSLPENMQIYFTGELTVTNSTYQGLVDINVNTYIQYKPL